MPKKDFTKSSQCIQNNLRRSTHGNHRHSTDLFVEMLLEKRCRKNGSKKNKIAKWQAEWNNLTKKVQRTKRLIQQLLKLSINCKYRRTVLPYIVPYKRIYWHQYQKKKKLLTNYILLVCKVQQRKVFTAYQELKQYINPKNVIARMIADKNKY